jgi:prolipoprotein diacylglyceryltransferase
MLASIPSPSANGFHIGPLFIHAYGLAYVVAVSAAVIIARIRWEAKGGNRELVYEVALWGFPAGLIGGRLYFLATSWNEVPPHWWGVFAIWKGGLGIWGGIALGTAVGLWRIRRVGNYFNQELFGGPTTVPWGLEISPAHRPPGYLQYATFQPTFLYEIVFDLVAAVFLVWLGRRGRIRPPGLFALYVALYSGFRIWEETLRIDPSKYLFGLRLNLYIAAILTLIGLVWFAWTQRRRPPGATPPPAAG